MSFMSRFSNVFRKKATQQLDDIRELGIQVRSDLALSSRIQDLVETMQIVKDPDLDINFRIDYLDSKIMTVAVPFLRAGSYPENFQLIKGWEHLIMFWKRIYVPQITKTRVLIEIPIKYPLPDGTFQEMRKRFWTTPDTALKLMDEKGAEIKERQVYTDNAPDEFWSAFTPEETRAHLVEIGEAEIIPLGMLVIAASFRNEDVSPLRVIVIQSQPGFGAMPTIVERSFARTGGEEG